MFEWQEQYSVGIGSIDGQHKKLFAIARELYRAISSGRGKSAVGRILDRLVQYTAVHFAHEERLMQQHNYPDFEEHKQEHEGLAKQVLAFQADYESGQIATVQLLQFLRNWLVDHTQGEDASYAPYLKAKARV